MSITGLTKNGTPRLRREGAGAKPTVGGECKIGVWLPADKAKIVSDMAQAGDCSRAEVIRRIIYPHLHACVGKLALMCPQTGNMLGYLPTDFAKTYERDTVADAIPVGVLGGIMATEIGLSQMYGLTLDMAVKAGWKQTYLEGAPVRLYVPPGAESVEP